MRAHGVLVENLGHAVPHSVCDPAANTGWLSIGVDIEHRLFSSIGQN